MQLILLDNNNEGNPRPFLKWAGGKTQLLEALISRVNALPAWGAYHEPFLGSGALFFALYRKGLLAGKLARLSDNNPRLIEAYQGVRFFPEEIIALLQEHKSKHDKEHYYNVRATEHDTLPKRAARVIYLNRTCFNGLYRENSKGGFNVPMGRYSNPLICDEDNLRSVTGALATAELACRPFQDSLTLAQPGDFVYLDPPYHPLSNTANFTEYNNNPFGEIEQQQLATQCSDLDKRGVYFLLSNSHTPYICELYKSFHIETVEASRNINRDSGKRGKVLEVLVNNFKPR